MDQRTIPSPRIRPLPPEHSPELQDQFEAMRKNLGFIPNSILIMQRKPKLAKALAQMTAAVWDPEGEVDRGLKRIHRPRGKPCGRLPILHGAHGQRRSSLRCGGQEACRGVGIPDEPLYGEAERAALDFALAAASVPNSVTDDMFARLRYYWTETQIVEIVGVISLFGFLNRRNDTMATPLEDEPIAVGEKFLAPNGWSVGKHRA
jgi:alkylhydroperoxidase family enzyme